MMHGSLGTERVAVRRNPNGGEGFVETHGLHGNLWKLFYAAVNWGHHVDQTGTKRIFEKSCAAVRFPATPCPESISGERHAVRWGAPPCDACKMAHSGAVSSWHHRTTGAQKMPARRAALPTSPSGALRHDSFQAANWLKLIRKKDYNQKSQQSTKESRPR